MDEQNESKLKANRKQNESKLKSVTVFASFIEAIDSAIPDDSGKGQIYTAIMHYALYGTEPELSGVPAAIFALMRPNIDNNVAKKISGRIGGSAKQNESKLKANEKQTLTDEEEEEDIDLKEKYIQREKFSMLEANEKQLFEEYIKLWTSRYGTGSRMTEWQINLHLKDLLAITKDKRIDALEASIKSGWRNIHEPIQNQNKGKFNDGNNLAGSDQFTRNDEI